MCYNTKKAFRAISHCLLKPFLEQAAPELKVDWSKVTQRNVDALHDEFLKLDDNRRALVDSNLYEIMVFAEAPSNATALYSQINEFDLAVPSGFDELSVHDKAMWVFLKNGEAWARASRFAHVDRMPDSMWFVQKLVTGNTGRVTYDPELIKLLGQEVSKYIYKQEGRGKYCYVEFMDRSFQSQECFFFYLSDYPRNNMQWHGGQDFARGIDNTAYEIVIVYDWLEKTISLRSNGERRHKTRLCKIWAKVMRDTEISDADAAKPVFSLDCFKNGSDSLTVDPMSDVRGVKILQLETTMDGKPGSRRVFQETERDLITQINEELNPDVFPMALMRVSGVKLRLLLEPSKYGKRKSTQTVMLRPDHCDIKSKDPIVQEVIKEALRGWQVCA